MARTRSSPVRTARRCSTSACRAARAASSSSSRSEVSGSASSGPSGPRAAAASWRSSSSARAARSASSCSTAAAIERVQPLGLAAGRAGLGAELAELLGDGGHPGVRLVQPVQRGLHVPGRRAPARPARSAGRTRTRSIRWPASTRRAPASSTAACTSSRLGVVAEPPAARSRPSRSPSAVTATRPGRASTSCRAIVRSSATTTSASSRVTADRRTSGTETTSRAARVPAGRSGRLPSCWPSAGPVLPTSRPTRPASSSLSSRIAASAAPTSLTATASATDPSAAAIAVSKPDSTREQRGDRTEDAGEAVAGGQHGAGAVLAGQAQLEGVLAGDQGGALLLGGPLLLAQLADLGVGRGQPERGLLVVGVEVLLAGVQPGDLVLDAAELGLGPGCALARLRQGRAEPAHLGLAGLDPAAPRRDLAGQPGQPLAAVGGRAGGSGHPALLDGQRLLGLLAAGHGSPEGLPLAADAGLDLVLLGAQPRGLGLELVGVAAGALVLGGRGEVPDPLGGQAAGAAEPLAQRRQPVPGLLGAGQRRRLGRGDLLELGLALPRLGQGRLDLGPARAQRGLVGHLGLERRGQLDQVVGEQAQPRVTLVGLDDRRAPGDLGLPAQRLELAAQLDGEVLHPGEVGLHGVQLAERLLLALAVLEDAGGLLDEAAALLRAGGQHGVELALPDDDVHLAADAGVGEQLLDVEQPARLAVDGVLRAAVAEHDPRDGDLGVVDRQGAVGVVDREADLGAAQRGRPLEPSRPLVPAKMTSSILPPRSDLAPCSPMTQARASTTLDLPDPFGPTTAVMPGSKWKVVADAKDLNPLRVRLFRCTRRTPRPRHGVPVRHRTGCVRVGRTSGGEGRGQPTCRPPRQAPSGGGVP